jgi:hypothetical protein
MKKIIVAAALTLGTILNAADAPSIIGHLESKGRVITIWAGQEPRYTVKTKDGNTLAECISLRELNAKFPELRRAVDGSYATWAGL